MAGNPSRNVDCNHLRSPKISRYSVSFQESASEVTPLIRDEHLVRPGTTFGSINCPVTNNSNSYSCDSEHESPECDASFLLPPGNDSINVLPRDRNQTFVDGTNGLKYSAPTDVEIKIVNCNCKHENHEPNCDLQIQKNLSDNVPDSHSGHCHSPQIARADLRARRRLIIVSVLCLVFMVGEIAGGYIAGSLAIMTDAAHLLTDFASFMISLFSLWVAARPATKRMSFGWYRAEVIGALTSVILIWVVTGVLIYLAIQRIVNNEYDIDAKVMLITSAVGVAINIIMGLTLHGHGHGHSHGGHNHSHSRSSSEDRGHTHNHVHNQENINVRAAFIHVVGDLIQSIGVFIAALVIYFKPTAVIMDPICTFLFSALVLLTTFAIMKDALLVLMEGKPKGINFNDVKESFLCIEGVVKVHNLRLWSLSMDKMAVSAHIVVNPGTNAQEILNNASQAMRSKYNFFEMTLQIEEIKEDMNNCSECQGPV